MYRNVWKEEPIDCANAVMCCISQLRKKLKVDSRNWNYIRTVRGVGYKFQPLSGE
ncbi:helix-turn-helix domain-containing protein [Fusicatenibacter sp. CLA-AA-H213]|nr:helix-turn-helix domain-containing protein [Fusicatenibacter sp. CLA-AA-H213]